MLAIYTDENVVGPLIAALRSRGLDVVTAEDRNLAQSPDELILTDALALQRLLLTNDTDFLSLAANCHQRDEVFAPIVFWSQQKRTLAYLIGRIVQMASQQDYSALCSQVHFL